MNKHIYPQFKEKIKKMKECERCHQPIVVHGNKKYCVTCTDIVFRERNNSYKRSRLMEKRYRIENV